MKTQPVIVDFETYYDKETSVTTQGLRNYVKATDAYIVSVVTDDVQFCGPIPELPKALGDSWMSDPAFQFSAANSNFDQAWWEKYFPKAALPWTCILDQAAFHQYPRDLVGVCRAALHIKLDKTIRDEMKGVDFWTLPDARQQEVIEYCLNDSIREKQALEVMAPMSPIEERVAAHTRLINRRGCRVNLDKLKQDCQHLEYLRHDAMHKLPWVEAGAKPLSYKEFSQWCKLNGSEPPASTDKRDVLCNQWILDNPKLAWTLKSMRVMRGSNTKLEKLRLMVDSADENNIIPLDLLYCGARHTRRWSSKNINVQNLDSKRAFEEEMAELPWFKEHPDEQPGIAMREYLIPPPGKKFGIIDFSQIEPRCLAWITRNEEMLEAVRQGYGIYEAHAKASMNWKGKPGTMKAEFPELYKFAKMRVLALGYGMGWNKFQATAALPPPQGLGVNLTNDQARDAVNDFRKSNRRIVQKWREMDRLIQQAGMERDDKTLTLEMPTGDTLSNFSIRRKRDGGYEGYTIKTDFSQMSHQPRLWGGTLVENMTQRMARDVLAEAILRVEDAGIPVAFHAHDEIVTVLDAATAENDFEEARRLMSVPPIWCADLPLAAEGAVCETYTKLN